MNVQNQKIWLCFGALLLLMYLIFDKSSPTQEESVVDREEIREVERQVKVAQLAPVAEKIEEPVASPTKGVSVAATLPTIPLEKPKLASSVQSLENFRKKVDEVQFSNVNELLKILQPFRNPMIDGNSYEGSVLYTASGFALWLSQKKLTMMEINRDSGRTLLRIQNPTTNRWDVFDSSLDQMQLKIVGNDPYQLVMITPNNVVQTFYTHREESVQYENREISSGRAISGFIYEKGAPVARFALLDRSDQNTETTQGWPQPGELQNLLNPALSDPSKR